MVGWQTQWMRRCESSWETLLSRIMWAHLAKAFLHGELDRLTPRVVRNVRLDRR
jgi:hypothetical protein